jgi:hypothetical protein
MLLLAVVVLLAWVVSSIFKGSSERMEIRGAWNLIADYDRMRAHLGELSVTDTVDYLNITVHAKVPEANNDLNHIVERERTQMVQNILMDLRKKTGEDLGSDPEIWMEKYGYGSTNTNLKAAASGKN